MPARCVLHLHICRRELESMLSLDCKAEIESVSQLGDDFLTAAYIPDKMEQLRHAAEVGAAASAVATAAFDTPSNQPKQQSNGDPVVSGAAAAAAAGSAAPFAKPEPHAHSIPHASIFGELQLDKLPSLHGRASASSSSSSEFGSAFRSESIDDDDLLAAFDGATAATAGDAYEENQWFI